MLINIDPLLNGELLYALRSMGHGDELALVDVNFPAESVAADTAMGSPIRLDGTDIIIAAKAIFTVFPLDSFVTAPTHHMQVVGQPERTLEVHEQFRSAMRQISGRDWPLQSLERHRFYDRARNAFVVIVTGERRSYADFLMTKGAIGVDGQTL
jgi:L-fucose mutarotase